ncbi:hypothetical protein GCM10020331_093330 [Ectobacillus funiculus]
MPVRKKAFEILVWKPSIFQQFHVWSDEWVNQGDWFEAIETLKQEGKKIRSFGVSINDYQPENAIKLIETGIVDTVQVIYNIFLTKALKMSSFLRVNDITWVLSSGCHWTKEV